VRLSARQLQDADERKSRALRWRPSARELEQDWLARARRAPAQHERAHAHAEASDAWRLLRLDERSLGGPDARQENAAVERVQPPASPPPTGDRDGARRAGARERCDGGNRRETRDVRGREPEAERGRVGGGPDQGITSPFSCASFEGPIPGTAWSSSTLRKGPCAWR